MFNPLKTAFFIAAFATGGTQLFAQTPTSYEIRGGETLLLPLGDLSFADVVLDQVPGDGKQPVGSATDPNSSVGAPDYSGNTRDGSFLTLGCNGSVKLGFVDNALTDNAGPDLYVFEVGPQVEGTFLAVSNDGENWIEVGKIAGGQALIDLADTPAAGGTYRAVRLTDDGEDCGGGFPGADIDAVAAVGSELRFVLDGAVLFDTGSSELKESARAALAELAEEIDAAGISSFDVIGHTDSVGSDADNLALSSARAEAVKAFFETDATLSDAVINTQGAGESQPVADNDTAEGRAENRRVEIVARSSN